MAGEVVWSSWRTANHSPAPHTSGKAISNTIIGNGMGGVQIISAGQKFGPSGPTVTRLSAQNRPPNGKIR